jgi:hypothetical protein
LADAILLIQRNERGRQGKLRAKYLRDLKIEAERETAPISTDEQKEVNDAVIRIQRVYRGYIGRKIFKDKQKQELIFLGMELAPQNSKNLANFCKNNSARRKILQKQYEQDYLAALITTKQKFNHLIKNNASRGTRYKRSTSRRLSPVVHGA